MRWAQYVVVAMLALLPAGGVRAPNEPTRGPVAHTDTVATETAPAAGSQPAQPIAGWIVDGAGLPIAGVRVALRGATVTATSEPDGAFRIAAPAGKRVLLLDAPHVFPAELAWREGQPAPRIMLARRARLEARVLANGQPVANAEVRITDGSRPTLAVATSDGNGVVRFADLIPGPYELWARQGTTVSPLVRISEIDATRVELALAPAGSIRGKVLVDGPLPRGVTVWVEPLDLDHAVRTAALDDQGRFTIDGGPTGRWRVEAAAPGFVPSSEVIATRGPRDEIAVRLHRAGVVTGTVVDLGGGPVAGAIVLRANGAGAQPVEERRRVVANARLRWVHPLAGQRTLPAFDSSRFGSSRPGARPAECGGGHCGLDLGAKKGTIIHAAADGEIALAFTEIRGEAGRYVAIDHGDGVRTFYMHMDELRSGLEIGQRIRAGDPIGTVGSTGFSSAPHLHFAITQEQAGRTWYMDPEPIIRHAVVLPAPRALDRAEASDAVLATLRWSEVGRALTAAAPQQLATDARGRFRVEGVVPGSYVAVAFAPRLAPGTSGAFSVQTATETPDVLVTLRPGTLVHGRVLGRDGAIAGATIVAGGGTGESVHKLSNAYTNAAGEFTLHSLTGRIMLSVTAPGYGTIERVVTLDDRARHAEDFVLTIENAQLRGQVLAPDGGTAGLVSIRIVDGPPRRRATTDAMGRFSIDRVAGGAYTIELAAADFPVKRVQLQSDRFQEIRLEPGGGVRIALRDTHSSAALPGLRIEATGPDRQVVKRVTDARGVAELRGLAAGDWSLLVRATGYATVVRAIAIRAERVPQDLRIDLARGAILGGVVRDRYGRRVPGARVSIGTLSTQSDADGNFRFDDAPTGPQQLEVEHGQTRAGISLQLRPGETRLSLSIELTE
ncbi:MAG: carboxypeptidase regulatory-like domain-containing protein [Kofleriaceae bacterium]